MCCAACVVYSAVLLALVHPSSAFIDPITLGSVAVGSAALLGYKMLACRYNECCDERWIPANITRLEKDLSEKVFGQHLVQEIVVNALRGHFRAALQTKKALALSFHGWQGGGKNYVAQFVMNSLYQKGPRSQFVHFFTGKAHFPLQEMADIYRMHLQDWIRGNVSKCDRTLFVFDEVDKMPQGVLDAVKPFLDYHEQIDGVDFRKAVFIFISNTGSKLIAQKHVELWETGRRREDMELRDFEALIRGSAFNEQGGFGKADVIGADLIDHYVPFLPLEESHVKLCIKAEFRHRGILHPHPNHIREVMKDVTFGAGNSMKFSKSGCKRISQQVVTLIEKLGYGHL